MLAIENLHRSYGPVRALDGVSLSIQPGEVLALIGPNGAGKTTLVSIVAGLRRPDSGRVVVDGIDVTTQPELVQERIGLASQDLALYPTVSVRHNLTLFGELAGLRRAELRQRIEETADLMALGEHLDRPVRNLSGGEKRRLHMALAIVHRPPLLLLDEPTAGVDVVTRPQLLEAVRLLAADGSAVCYSTHYLPEVEQLDAEVVILDRGRLVAHSALPDLLRKHASKPMETVEPQLETVFRTLTGRRFGSDDG